MVMPEFPKFEPFDKRMKPILDEYLLKYQPELSEYTFTNLFAWRKSKGLFVSAFRGFILLRGTEAGKDIFFEPIGSGDTKAAVLAVCPELGSFQRVSERTVSSVSGDARYIVEADRDNMDYLYLVDDLAALKGKKYDGKRNFIKKFKARYAYEYVKLDEKNVRECLAFEEKWCLIKDCDHVEGLTKEREAVTEMIENFAWLGIIGGAIRMDGKVRAIAFGERLNKETIVLHVLKAEANIPGLYQTIANEFFIAEGGPFRYANFEQDLGIPGLREAKGSYHPVRLVPKYIIRGQ